MASLFLYILLLFLTRSSAYLCINCGNCQDDGNSFCDPNTDKPVCLNDHLGGCKSQVTRVITSIAFTATTTSTQYTTTVNSYSTYSSWIYTTTTDLVTSTTTQLSTQVQTKTSTLPGPTITVATPARRVYFWLKRAAPKNTVPSTTTISTITNDPNYCYYTPTNPKCTDYTQGVWTNYLTTTLYVTSTVASIGTTVVTVTSTIASVLEETVTGDPTTKTVTSNSPPQTTAPATPAAAPTTAVAPTTVVASTTVAAPTTAAASTTTAQVAQTSSQHASNSGAIAGTATTGGDSSPSTAARPSSATSLASPRLSFLILSAAFLLLFFIQPHLV